MTEKEKMDLGLLYDANNDDELIADRAACKDMCYEFNQLRPSQLDEKNAIIRKLFAQTGESFEIVGPLWCDYGNRIKIGNNFFLNHNCVMLDGGGITFGDNVFIAHDCSFTTAGHPFDYEQRNIGLEYAYPITVGDNVWIGCGVHVMPGVTIGSNVVIGGGSVVTKNIPDGVVAAGNPCRVIRKMTDADKERYKTSEWKAVN